MKGKTFLSERRIFMKKIFSLLFVISILLTFITINSASVASTLNINESEESHVILTIPYSSNIIGITGMDGEGGEEDTGPESFFVTEDNHIYILDSNNYQILNFYDGNQVETIKVDTDKERMIDIAIAEKYIYILLNNDVILKVDHNGAILDKINVSSYRYTEKFNVMNVTTEITIKSKSVSYEDGCLKVYFQDGKGYNLTDTKTAVEERNIGASKDGFTAITSAGSKIEFPSFSRPASADKETSTKEYDIYYTSEIYNAIGNTIMNRRLYYIASGKIVKYVQLEPTQFSLPNRLYRVMQDGTVYQMITSDDKLDIVKLGFLTDYTKKPAYIDMLKNESVSTFTNGTTKSIKTVSDPYTAAIRAQDIVYYEWSFNPSTHGNKILNGIPDSVVQPYYLVGLQDSTDQTGIPYAYYGSRGIDVEYQSDYDTTFPEAVAAGKYTGNAGDTSTTEKACGLDCSGFVDVVYQTGSKHSTKTLVGSGRPFYQTSGDAEYMDI